MMCEGGRVSLTDHTFPVVTLLKSGHWTEKKRILLEYEPYDTERKIIKKSYDHSFYFWIRLSTIHSRAVSLQLKGANLYSHFISSVLSPPQYKQSVMNLEPHFFALKKNEDFQEKCLRKLSYSNDTTLQFSCRVQLQVFEFGGVGEVLHLGDSWGRDLKKPFN